ncbi:MAG: DUF4157 domain-containing protein, partial [Rubrivivax sp.]|nr:DUF4157 domain-containing protein [Rubrivivax sp.]
PPAPSQRLQRACACGARGPSSQGGECEACRKKRVQRRSAAPAPVVAPTNLGPLASGGHALPHRWRQHVEPLFGTSFDAVRVHDDATSHAAARRLQAHAFTVGQHVHFAAGRFAPHTRDGLHLLAHELTHTVQQRGGPSVAAASSDIDAPDAPLEREADARADAVVAGRAAPVRGGTATGLAARLQRDAEDAVTLDDDHGDGTGVSIARTLEDRPCAETPETRTTPRDRIFEWDRDANAVKLNYSLCHGSVRLTTESSIDYTRVVEAGTRLLDTLRQNPAAGADLPTLGRTAIDQASLSAQGNVTLTVDGILQARVGAESTIGSVEQQIRVTGQLRITPNGVSFTITGFIDASRTPTLSAQQYSLNLRVGTRWFAVNLGYQVDDRQPAAGPATSQGRLRIGAEIPLPDVGPLRDLTLQPRLDITRQPGEAPGVAPGISFGGRFGGPDRTPAVSCYFCQCPPPLPHYRCTPYGTRQVVDRQADTQRLPLMYQYDSETPAEAAAYAGRVQAIAAMVGQGYAVQAIRGYASPEGTVEYNQGLATRRAEAAHGAIAQVLPAGSPALPAAEGVGELLGASATRPGAEAANSQLTTQLVAQLSGLGPNERLNLLEVDPAVRADPAQRQAALDDIQAFVDGRDAQGRRIAGRARWERVFPFMRRVDVELHLTQLSHPEREAHPDDAGGCDEAQRARIDAAHPIPPARRLPRERCRS